MSVHRSSAAVRRRAGHRFCLFQSHADGQAERERVCSSPYSAVVSWSCMVSSQPFGFYGLTCSYGTVRPNDKLSAFQLKVNGWVCHQHPN